jgi:hypothetical protein
MHMILDVGRGRLVDVSSVTSHGPTLRHLGLTISVQNIYNYSHTELATILCSSPHPESLANNLCLIDMGKSHTVNSGFNDVHGSSELGLLLVRTPSDSNDPPQDP